MKLSLPLIALGTVTVTMLAISAAAYAQSVTGEIATETPANSYRPGSWQPVARVNPDLPIQVSLLNQTGVPLTYNLPTGADSFNPISVDGSAVLSNIVLPADVLVFPNLDQSLKYEVSVVDNTVTVQVQSGNSDTPGNRSLVIDQTGAIYVY